MAGGRFRGAGDGSGGQTRLGWGSSGHGSSDRGVEEGKNHGRGAPAAAGARAPESRKKSYCVCVFATKDLLWRR